MPTDNPTYRRNRHSVSLPHAHLVFVTKNRRRVFTEAMLTYCENTMRAVCADLGAEWVEFNGQADHCETGLRPAANGTSSSWTKVQGLHPRIRSSVGINEQRPVTRRDIVKYALSAPVLLGLGTAAATLGTQKATAASMQLLDFAERLVPADQIKSAGYDGALVYVSELRPGADFDFKPVTREYADVLRAEGLHVVSCYQYGKPGWPTSPSDFTRGYDGGVADAQTALRLHGAAGGPDSAPIFFSVDEGIDLDTWNSLAVGWFRGINSVLGVARTGVYGSASVCGWAIRDGVIGRSTAAGYRWAWQTRAWSAGAREPAAVLYQYVIVTASDPGVLLGGTHVDVDEVLAADFGQWDLDR